MSAEYAASYVCCNVSLDDCSNASRVGIETRRAVETKSRSPLVGRRTLPKLQR